METVVIDGTLPDLNTMINEAKRHKMEYHKLKKQNTEKCQWVFKKLPPDFDPDKIFLNITYYVPNWKTDIDNVAAAKKFILDGLVKEGIVDDDTHSYIKGWKENFKKDKENPRIKIVIEEVVTDEI